MKSLFDLNENEVTTIKFALENSLEYIENHFNWSKTRLEQVRTNHKRLLERLNKLKFKY